MHAGIRAIMDSLLRPIWARALVFCGIYVCCAFLGLMLSSEPYPNVGFWLPSGLYVGVLLLVPTRQWGWIFAAGLIADLLFDMSHGQAPIRMGLNAVTNGFEAFLGALLVKRFVASRPTLESLREFGGFLLFTSGASAMAAGVLWAATMPLRGAKGSFGTIWLQWWSGDALGILVMAPFLLVWWGWRRDEWRGVQVRRWIEGTLLAVLLLVAIWLLFYYPGRQWLGHKYLLVPLIIWAALRFGLRGVTLVVMLGAVAIAYPTMGHGAASLLPARNLFLEPALQAQWFIVVLSLTGLVVGVVWEENARNAAQLRENEEHFRLLYQNAPVAYQSLDVHGNFLDVNQVWLDMMGYAREEVVGYWFGDFLVRSQSDLFRQRFPQFKEIGQIHNLEFDMERKDGRVVIVAFEGRVGYDKQHVFRQTHCVMRNITEIKQAENALRESELRYRTLFDDAVEGIVLADRNLGVVRDCNRAFLVLTGWDKMELTGHPLAAFVVSTHGGGKPNDHALSMSDASNAVIEAQIQTKNGEKKFVEIKTKVLELNHEVVAQHFFRDVTARKHAEDDRDRLFKMSIDMLFVAGFDGYFKQINPAWGHTLGWSEQEMLATPWLDLVHPADQAVTLAAEEDLRQDRPLRAFENRIRCKDGSYRWLSWNSIPLVADKLLFGVVRDITGLKQAEAQLKKLNSELESRVLERTGQLEAANKELEAFAYSISHDLRAPLRAVNGFSSILLRDHSVGLDAEAARFLQLVSDNAQKMGRLIDDLLTFSRLSRQPLRKQMVNTADLVQATLMEMKEQEEKAGRPIKVRVGNLPTCRADSALLKQVWLNLLSNAFKYTRHCEAAAVEIGVLTQEPGALTFFVRDNGAGFDMRYAGKLFGVFQRLHREDEFEGTGVGLAIVQRIVQRHGGRVWAEGRLNQGACFYFTLPN